MGWRYKMNKVIKFLKKILSVLNGIYPYLVNLLTFYARVVIAMLLPLSYGYIIKKESIFIPDETIKAFGTLLYVWAVLPLIGTIRMGYFRMRSHMRGF